MGSILLEHMMSGSPTSARPVAHTIRDFASRQNPPCGMVLGKDEVQVWLVSVKRPESELRQFHEMLADDERERARRFYFERDRRRFIAARGFLRALLGGYLQQQPASLRFSYNRYGKPALAAGAAATHELTFNLSHSHEFVLYAFSRNRALGVDIEYMRSNVVFEQIVERFFSPQEVKALRRLPVQSRREAFFKGWTRKEAFIKAHGEGLSLPLDHFDVTLTPGEPVELKRFQDDPQELARWSLYGLEAPLGYAAALAVEGRGLAIHYCRLHDESARPASRA